MTLEVIRKGKNQLLEWLIIDSKQMTSYKIYSFRICVSPSLIIVESIRKDVKYLNFPLDTFKIIKRNWNGESYVMNMMMWIIVWWPLLADVWNAWKQHCRLEFYDLFSLLFHWYCLCAFILNNVMGHLLIHEDEAFLESVMILRSLCVSIFIVMLRSLFMGVEMCGSFLKYVYKDERYWFLVMYSLWEMIRSCYLTQSWWEMVPASDAKRKGNGFY